LESEKLNCLNGNTVKQKGHSWNTKARRLGREINSEKCNSGIGKSFCQATDKFKNPSYILNRKKIPKCRYYKTERENEYKELVESIRTSFGKPRSVVTEQTQTPAFDHDNQDPFLDSEYTIPELRFAIKTSASKRAQDGME
jgi:hypothetical protein